MNVAHLRYARAVAREGSFGRAARACSVTQPALSNGIAVLERMLGGRLFDRTTRGVTPTPLGERILPLIEHTLQGLDAVIVEARLASGSGPRALRIGVSTLINRELIGRAFEAASTVIPEHAVVLKTAPVQELNKALSEAELDLVLVPVNGVAPEVQRATIASEQLMYIDERTRGDHGGQAVPIQLDETSATALILPTDACGLAPYTRKVFADSGVPLRTYAGEAFDCRVLQDWVALGLGAALLPESKILDLSIARPLRLDDKPVIINYEARWLVSSPLRARISGIVALLTTISAKP